MSYIGSSARPGDLYDEDDECIRCHKTMHTQDGCDPTKMCHNCAHERVEELEAKNQRLRNLLASASLALYQTHFKTWQEQVKASLAKTYTTASAHEAGEIIKSMEKEKE